MPSSERAVDRAVRKARRFLVELGEEIRRGRARIGLSQAALGALAGMSQSQVARIEAGRLDTLGLLVAARLLALVGHDLAPRIYPGPAPARDASQLVLGERLHARIPEGYRWRTEVALGLPGDQRAWDAVTDLPGVVAAWELVTRLDDVQAVERTIHLKQRDGHMPCVVLVLKRSRHNRLVLAASPQLRRSFPVGSRVLFADLRRARQPAGNALILL